MIKVSKILTASAWLHAWLEPSGAIHQFEDQAHASWAFKKYAKECGQEDAWDALQNEGYSSALDRLLDKGWVRLGAFPGSCYMQVKRPPNRLSFQRAQAWLQQYGSSSYEITIEVSVPNKYLTVPFEDFLTMNKVEDAFSAARVR